MFTVLQLRPPSQTEAIIWDAAWQATADAGPTARQEFIFAALGLALGYPLHGRDIRAYGRVCMTALALRLHPDHVGVAAQRAWDLVVSVATGTPLTEALPRSASPVPPSPDDALSRRDGEAERPGPSPSPVPEPPPGSGLQLRRLYLSAISASATDADRQAYLEGLQAREG